MCTLGGYLIYYICQMGLDDLPVCASQVLGWQACTIMPSMFLLHCARKANENPLFWVTF